jgi:hypothetical protein
MSNTVKVSRRINAKSPKYGYGYHRLNSGYRLDIPYVSVSVFDGGSKATVRRPTSGLRFIYENNRKGKVRVAHNVG